MTRPVIGNTYRCGRCSIVKPLTDYHRDSTRRGRGSICKACRANNRSVIAEMLSNARKRSLKKGIAFSLTRQDIEQLRLRQSNKCIYSGVELNWNVSSGGRQRVCPPDRASLDRIDSSMGYTAENVQLVTDFCNRIKCWYPEKDILVFCKLVIDNIKVRD